MKQRYLLRPNHIFNKLPAGLLIIKQCPKYRGLIFNNINPLPLMNYIYFKVIYV